MKFWLGTHRPTWLRRTNYPLFISRRVLAGYINPPRALGPWALDGGGFTELQLFGRWETAPLEYAIEVRRWRDEIGNLAWAAIQDWMCEPLVISGGRAGATRFRGTGLGVAEHQARTVRSWLDLRDLAPDLPWVPVLQGWQPDDYRRHFDMYAAAGTDLTAFPLVGVGSVCKRQHTPQLLAVLRPLAALGLRLHGFGVKIDGLRNGAAGLLSSSDSMAWSRAARYDPPLPGCRHKTCANCVRYALGWRDQVLAATRSGEKD